MKSKERLYLDESRWDGNKKSKSAAKAFLLEVEGGTSYLERCKLDPNLPLYLTGIIQSGDKPNRNGRIYPWEYLKRECLRYMENEVRNGLAFSELDHPENSTTPSLKNAAAVMEDIWFKGKDVYGRLKVLNAFMPETAPGKMIRGIILNGKNVGISSRALGSLQEDAMSEYDMVDEDLEMICWDIVSNASNFGSEKLDLTENQQKRKAILTESQCFGDSCGIKPVQEFKFQTLTESEKIYVNILGVERFLQLTEQLKNRKGSK